MDIQDFRNQLMDELREKAEAEGTGLAEQFLAKALDELEMLGELKDPIPMHVELAGRRGRKMGLDAYAYDEADNSLVLIACDFREETEADELINRSRIDDLCRRMSYFVEESLSTDMATYAYGQRAALQLAREFKEKIGTGMVRSEVLRFKFYVVSNAQLSRHVKDTTQEDFLGRPVTLNVWTLERFFHAYLSDVSEAVEFDTAEFGCPGLPFLKANPQEDVPYDAYLCVVPGRLLADLYLKYGSRLLQGNVRAFLSLRGKVNKGIRRTIMDEPENFFIYNNGISVVARSVGFSPRGDQIVHLRDFQIINGGQTTASLANAIIRKEDKNGMDELFVPMKLTVVNVGDDMTEEEAEHYFSLTKTISKCANSQNAVSDADFFSNHPYHTTMEGLARKVMAPPVDGNPMGTTWFYERSRGKWEQEQMRLTPAEQKRYREEHPKKQVIKKEKLARCLSAFALKAHRASEAAAQCFKHFADDFEDTWENHRASINEEYFKKCVCKVIVFDELDTMVSAAPWYPKNGMKTDIVSYAIAKLMTLIPQGRDLDWVTIWKRQRIYPALADELRDLAHEANDFLHKTAAGRYPHIIAKTEATWKAFQEEPWTLSEEFLRSLVSLDDQKIAERQAVRTHRFNDRIDAQVEIFKLGAPYWMEVYNALRSERILSTGDLELIRNIAQQINGGRLPASTQCKRLVKAITKAEDAGYLMPTPPQP